MIEECKEKRFICDRCGKEKIVPIEQKANEWEYLLFHKVYHLCPECSISFKSLLKYFLERR